ncbi:lytic transglycosylase domain-containing protein [Nitrosomonas mobilis]|uniref:Lytic transglycosylase, catalytic n=1 Tax=Nitrosomonas mobilis TaxID=51642 RepID=A0A1G5SB50_9PROT|nr:lytic transglycosylase domain-containing protein [Nitrosomonas mobilis]SCZ84382.1 Lytic transglycosylase, catalytic [Nitrosomonas mobilis]
MKKILAGWLLFWWTGLLVANMDGDFIKVQEAFRAKDAAKVAFYADRLRKHPLAPYAEYYRLRLSAQRNDETQIRNFLARHQGSYIADKLRGEWLQVLGEGRQWRQFGEEFPKLGHQDDHIICFALHMKQLNGDQSTVAELKSRWLSGRNMPRGCTAPFQELIRTGKISTEDIWSRIRAALAANNTSVAKESGKYLATNQVINPRTIDMVLKNPARFLDQQKNIKTRADKEVTLFALLRLLRSETNHGLARWLKLRGQFSAADQSYFLGNLAYWAAMRQDERALNWFTQATSGKETYPLSATNHAWWTRIALRQYNWPMVLQSIEAMPESMQQEDVWRYWRARAFKSIGRKSDANTLLAKLSNEHSYYGQLAKEELGVMMSIPAARYTPGAQEIRAMENDPGVRRALALYRLNQRIEANREWIWTIKDFSDQQLLAAAKVAERHQVYDRAINTALKTVSQHDFSLRYLAPYRAQMKPVIKQQQLDEAYVYGLIRQESRFIPDIKSSAGAMGLMQLMPATAKWVASKLGIPKFQTGMATEINTNLQLGTYYLRHVLDQLDQQPLLAAAAYNAGPGRARRWRDVKPLEGAVYAETIPFNETREYVQVVLNNSMYYASQFNHQQRPTLKERLGIVAAKKPN